MWTLLTVTHVLVSIVSYHTTFAQTAVNACCHAIQSEHYTVQLSLFIIQIILSQIRHFFAPPVLAAVLQVGVWSALYTSFKVLRPDFKNVHWRHVVEPTLASNAFYSRGLPCKLEGYQAYHNTTGSSES